MINSVTLVGRLTKDIELKKTSSNISTCTFTVACNRRYAKEGEQQADFINCVAWRQSAEFLDRYAKKGDIVGVTGRITTRNYEGQNGKVYVTEVTCDSVQLIGGKEKSEEKSETFYRKEVDSDSHFRQETLNGDDRGADGFKEYSDIKTDDLPFY